VVDDERLAGGVNEVVRSGATVRRPVGPWTPAVHHLLDHLAAVGFTGAPRAYGLDESGREILDFLAGDVPDSDYVTSDAALSAVAALLREFHDATAGFVPPPDAAWYFRAQQPSEVICHGDIAPYNCVFRGGMPVAFIDFDTAHPAPRVWDVAYAAYRFVPLSRGGGSSVAEQTRRLGLFCDAYRLGAADRAILVDTVVARLDHLVAHMYDQAAAGSAAFAGHIAAGHADLYRADAASVTEIDFG
jgi:phosphotransferase family enzyme